MYGFSAHRTALLEPRVAHGQTDRESTWQDVTNRINYVVTNIDIAPFNPNDAATYDLRVVHL